MLTSKRWSLIYAALLYYLYALQSRNMCGKALENDINKVLAIVEKKVAKTPTQYP